MKKLSLTFALILYAFALTAQVPAGFSYQAVVRNNDGNVVANQPVKFRISILRDSEAGTAVYVETHSVTTNAFGLANLTVGMGTSVSGSFSNEGWGAASHFMKIEIDPDNGSTFSHLGTMQLFAVPYAFHAQTVELDQVDDADADATNEIQELELSGTVLGLSKSSKTVILPSSGGGDNWGTQTVQTDTTLEGQGTTALPLKIAQQSATSGQVLKWSGTTWAPAADEMGEGGSNPTGPAGGDLTGIYPDPSIGNNTVTSAKIVDGAVGNADLAENSVTTLKIADGSIATADLANSTVTTDKLGNLAVSTEKVLNGAVTSDKLATNAVISEKINTGAVTGAKIAQEGATNGQALKWTGTTWAPGDDETGESGLTLPYTGTYSSGEGIFNITNSGTGNGIFGQGGTNGGVFGKTSSTTGRGVLGLSHTTGTGYGVDGQSTSPEGTGVRGIASSSTGTNFGVKGITHSAAGFSGHFTGGKFYVEGNAGIGTENPAAKLEVAGQVKITGGSPGEGKVLTSDAGGLASWQTPGSGGLTLPYSGTITHGDWIFKIKNESTTAAGGIYGEGSIGIWGNGYVEQAGTGVIGNGYFGIGGEGTYCGVSGSTYNTTGGMGVRGWARATSGECYGVHGKSESSSGIGVYGESPYIGIYGNSKMKSGSGYGVYGKSESSIGVGVYGESSNIGVYGLGIVGIYGTSNDTQGRAVNGRQFNIDGYSGYFTGGKFYVYGNVGIGDNPVNYRLEVYAPGTSSTGIAGFYNSAGEIKAVIRQTTNGGGQFNLYKSDKTATVTLLGEGDNFINSGDLGIGTDSPNYKLDVRGTIGNNTTLYHSDRRWKTDIMPVYYGIQDLMKLNGVSYLWNVADYPDMGFEKNVQFGFIAQEFEQVIPELVNTDKEGFKSIDYVKLTPLLVKAVQQQQKIIEGLKAENEQLKAENEQLKAKDMQLESRLERLEQLVGASVKN